MAKPKFIPLANYREYPVEEMVRRSAAFRAEMQHRRTVRHFSDREDTRLRLMRILQIAFPFAWLCGTVITPDTPLALVLLGTNANNLLLIPMAYAVVHLAMRTEGRVRMPLWSELGLLFTIWVIINFTAVNLYLKWTQ